MDKILVIGASGQIGSELTLALRDNFGKDNVFASDIKIPADYVFDSGPFVKLDVLDNAGLTGFIKENNITIVYHLAAILSANAENNPIKAWEINFNGLMNVLNIAKDGLIKKIFWPSSIAIFGPTTEKKNTPQLTVTEPITIYGISKLAGERWCDYYFRKFNVDVRSIRYPGLISYKTEAGGGTTDYAVEIFYDAVRKKNYECFLKSNTRLPMMFMPDAIRGTIELMETDSERISIRSGYNLASMSFTPEEIAHEISKHIPDFQITYKPDFRQSIAESWPESIDDSFARKDWNWKPEYDLHSMTKIMLDEIKKKSF